MSTTTSTNAEITADPAAKRMTSDERREQILAAAVKVFGARGYVGTTTDEVARAASISQPYVVRLFGSKEKLFLEALNDALVRLLTAFRAAHANDDGTPESDRMGRAYLDLLAVRGLHQILSQAFLLGGHPVIGPAARDGFAEVWTFLRDEVGFTTEQAHQFLATGMLINTMVGLRLTEEYGIDKGMTELFNQCFPFSVDEVLATVPRADEPW